MNKFSSKISYAIVMFFISAIIISFALTGFQGFSSSADSVAVVDGTPITISEYNQMLNAQLQRYSQFMGGKTLSAQEIRQFRIKESTLQTLVQQKLIQNLATKMKFNASEAELKEEIRKTPFFLTDGKFDVEKYKSILARNNYTPAKYEEVVKAEMASRKVADLFGAIQVSDNFAKDVLKFKKNTVTINAVDFDKEALTSAIEVSTQDIKNFVADAKNETILNSLFKSMQNEFNKEAQVKARHILLNIDEKNKEADVLKKAQALKATLNPQNFAKIAGKETEDPSGKGAKGGELGWFGKGRMVPEFEQAAFALKPGQISAPVKTNFGYHIILVEDVQKEVIKTLDQVKDQVAKRHLQKSNRKALTELVEVVKSKVKTALDKNDIKSLKALEKQYNLSIYENTVVNEFEQTAGALSLDKEKIAAMFNSEANTIIEEDGPVKVTLAKVVKRQTDENFAKEITEGLKAEIANQNRTFSNLIQNDILQTLEKQAKVVTYPKLL
jgi:peptidyl-prolyl cis-trans isomerase D